MLPILFRKKGVEELQFTIYEREIRHTSGNLVGDNADYTASFVFDSEWDNVVKTARFIKENNYVDVLLENDSCEIPVEILKGGYIRVGVFSSEMTTTYCIVQVNESIKEKHGSPVEPTPDIYSQIIKMLEDISANGVTDAQIAKAVNDYLTENPVSGVDEEEIQKIISEYVEAHKAELKGADGKDGTNGVDGKSAYEIALANGFEGSEEEWLASLKGKDGADGKDGVSGGSGETITVYNETSYRWQYVSGEIYPNSMYNYTTNAIEGAGTLYTCVHYIFNGEKKIRFSGTTSGGSARLAYAFVDKDGNTVKVPEFVKGELYTDTILDVPENAYEIYINGNNYVSPHLEVAVEDLRADLKTLPYLLSDFGKKLQYKEKFAWKSMNTGYIAFTFDDSLDDTADIVDLFISKGVPCCFGAIPEKLNMGLENGETIAKAMKRGVEAVGCEVLAHGGSGNEIVVESNIDDMDFLYNKFVVNKQKLVDFGFNVRGTVRVGGSGNICNDPRTDEWVRLFFDYGDLYGLEEPYNHARASIGTGIDGYKLVIDEAVSKKKFEPILFHQCPDYMGELIDYAISKGAVICNYATVYDTFGSTEEMVSLDSRISAIEQNNGNEVSY